MLYPLSYGGGTGRIRGAKPRYGVDGIGGRAGDGLTGGLGWPTRQALGA